MRRIVLTAATLALVLPAVGLAKDDDGIAEDHEIEVGTCNQHFDYCEHNCLMGTSTDMALNACIDFCEAMFCVSNNQQIDVPAPRPPTYRIVPHRDLSEDPRFRNSYAR